MDSQVYETLSRYFATQNPFTRGEEFELAVLEKLVEIRRCYLRGEKLCNIFLSVSKSTHPLVYSALLPFSGEKITIGVELAKTTILCDLRIQPTIDGDIWVDLYSHNSFW